MRLVIDASVAVKWLANEQGSDDADRLLDGRHDLHTPRLMVYEVGNALWVKGRRGILEREEAVWLAGDLSNMPLVWHDDLATMPDAVALALELDRPVYDCVTWLWPSESERP